MRLVKSTEEMIAVMQAYVDGKTIECKHLITGCGYIDLSNRRPDWDWNRYDYRVKKEQYRPFTPEEAVKYIGKKIIHQGLINSQWTIQAIYQDKVMIEQTKIGLQYIHVTWVSYEDLLSDYNIISEDGFHKCGVKL